MQDIINSIKESTNAEKVKRLLKPFKIKEVIKIAKGINIDVRGNENKTEIINNIILGIVKREWFYLKTNIRKVGLWWKWDEYCNKCGEQTKDDNYSSATKPEIGESDYCNDCLRKIINDSISKK